MDWIPDSWDWPLWLAIAVYLIPAGAALAWSLFLARQLRDLDDEPARKLREREDALMRARLETAARIGRRTDVA